MKRALLIGIDAYDEFSGLGGCVADATRMRDMLQRHENGDTNYECRLLTTSKGAQPITSELLDRKSVV